MADTVPSLETLPRVVTAAHLTEALRRAGVLGDAAVDEVVVDSARLTLLSRIIRLRLSYDSATEGAPPTLIMKTAKPGRGESRWVGGQQEVAFYTHVAPQMKPCLVPRCFDAAWDAATKDWHVLLEDLTETHAVPTVWPLPPTLAQCEHIVDAQARFHAAWWGDPRLGVSVGTLRDAAGWDRLMQELTQHFGRFADALPQERRMLFERLFEAAPRLFERYRARHNLTIVHGDAHVWNCFLPRDGGSDVRLFDWDGWRIGVVATDLAYMMAMHWYPDRRRRIERLLLDRYHATLLAEGVNGYDRQALTDDYRWAVLWLITTPVWQAAYDIPPVVWWNNLERILLAVDDLGCRDLLT
jgi:Ecdysteroid kinase-like family